MQRNNRLYLSTLSATNIRALNFFIIKWTFLRLPSQEFGTCAQSVSCQNGSTPKDSEKVGVVTVVGLCSSKALIDKTTKGEIFPHPRVSTSSCPARSTTDAWSIWTTLSLIFFQELRSFDDGMRGNDSHSPKGSTKLQEKHHRSCETFGSKFKANSRTPKARIQERGNKAYLYTYTANQWNILSRLSAKYI